MANSRDIVIRPLKRGRAGIEKGLNKFRVYWFVWENQPVTWKEVTDHMSTWLKKRDSGAAALLRGLCEKGLLKENPGKIYTIPEKRRLFYWKEFCKSMRLRGEHLRLIKSMFNLEKIKDLEFQLALADNIIADETEEAESSKENKRLMEFEMFQFDLFSLVDALGRVQVLEKLMKKDPTNRIIRNELGKCMFAINQSIINMPHDIQSLNEHFKTNDTKAKVLNEIQKAAQEKMKHGKDVYEKLQNIGIRGKVSSRILKSRKTWEKVFEEYKEDSAKK